MTQDLASFSCISCGLHAQTYPGASCPKCGGVLAPAPLPAMQPLHPPKPPAPIVPGRVWAKIASGKTTVGRPQCQILAYFPADPSQGHRSPRVQLWRLDRSTQKTVTESEFRRDWEPQ